MVDLSNPGIAILVVVLLLIWIAILAWLATSILNFCARRYGWGPMNWRGWLVAFGGLVAAIHIANYLLDLLNVVLSDSPNSVHLTYPSAFLIGSVAIGVGVAVVHLKRM